MCQINIKVNCPHCHSTKVVKNGKKRTGMQNFLCRPCGKQFQYAYFYQGSNPLVKSQVKSSLLHGSGIRDCYKVFGVSYQTTLNMILSEGKRVNLTPQRKHYERVQIDEMYSFVGKKDKKVWIFYAYAPQTKEILAVTMGKRSRKQLQSLLVQLKNLRIEIDFYCTDKFKAFKEVLPYYNRLIGKKFTKNIEGINTLIRSKIARFHRRTTKFSKKLTIQWFLMKIFISYFNRMPSYI